MMTPISQVAVSYAWKEEQGGKDANAVEKLCDKLRKQGIQVLRDKDGLKLGDDLREFMQQIGTSDFLCVFLSDAYLKSFNCMTELLTAWNHSGSRPEEFRRSVKVWVMESAKGIFHEGRLDYTDHWVAEHTKRKTRLKKHLGKNIGGREVDELNILSELATKVNDILTFIKRTLTAPNFQDFEAWICSQLPTACAAPSTPAPPSPPLTQAPSTPLPSVTPPPAGVDEVELARRLREVFPTQIKEIERILSTNEPLRAAMAVRLLEGDDLTKMSPQQITEKLWLRFHVEFLQSVSHFAKEYEASSEKEVVLELASTAIFLCMCPDYASRVRPADRTKPKAILLPDLTPDIAHHIAEILLCWTHQKPFNLAAPPRRQAHFVVGPENKFEALEYDLMKSLDIDPKDAQARSKLQATLLRKHRFGPPEFRIILDKEQELLAKVASEPSTMYLLVFIMKEGETLRPGSEPLYDFNVEGYIKEFKQRLSPL